MQPEHHSHEFAPVFDHASTRLILGSFPSVKSREQGFYYGHPKNRFWKVLAALFSAEVPETVAGKKEFLLAHHLAVWDVIESCTITGSSDSSIRDVMPNDIEGLLRKTQIKYIYANGKTAERLYLKYIGAQVAPVTVLPSTSPANAAYSLEHLIECWKPLLK